MSHGKSESNPHESSTCMDGGHGGGRDVLEDFWQATFDLHSYLSRAQEHQQSDVTVPTSTLKTLLESVETIKAVQSLQERRSVASLYFGTLLGVLIGIIGNFFVSFLLMPQGWWNTLGVVLSLVLLFLVCVALFLQAKKYAE